MSIFKNNKEEENRVAASEPHVESRRVRCFPLMM